MHSVWRIEWEFKPHHGPYSAPDGKLGLTAMIAAGFDASDTLERPAPCNDFKPQHNQVWRDNTRYGFASVRELVRWFDRKRRKKLREVGYLNYRLVLARYETLYVVQGRRQVAFDVSNATRKEWRYL